ncbi:uncharacterized protein ACLA_022900 [Aspergillus clavatus NRRL 1]|uniref:N-acetylgalactosaminide beta-1,3-galactosyltransferase n=1 Tax=Aspergillus clavatus (strain ATCC 1007 / CBS 513.65 / DSM 816 / NCTC 3887 / NRRL 1 / QM 1276 / 107) TaxID=344612 RepID=A1CPK5_ASPCL|nr:uncharacterized protein ACLA_022900 [Aspergillus clavatus NRRL 1]EAW07576.1 hypothetical protein ACLA_022900 [Aspergillus clavatus NRRL 1]
MQSIQVILKTGATEALNKLPAHLSTILPCLPNTILFSDFEETINGSTTLDVLRAVDEDLKSTHPDFDLYRRLQHTGRAALTRSDLTDDPSTPSGKPTNPGWKLDKWKFLPMINETFHLRNDADWYLFMEADTYIFWSNLASWLGKLNAQEPFYLGNQVQIGDVVFAHGGSGFVLSRPAMEKVLGEYVARKSEWEEYTDKHWAGDCVLGKALADSGVKLSWSWPMLQGDTPGEFDYFGKGYGKRSWCVPAVAWHHMTPEEIREMWVFDRRWSSIRPLMHQDVLYEVIMPKLGHRKEDWDNLSGDGDGESAESVEDCENKCVGDAECLQYSYKEGHCHISRRMKRGAEKSGMTSGWMMERINGTVERQGDCEEIGWITF